MKFLDGMTLKQANATELVNALVDLSAGLDRPTILVEDEEGNPIERVKLFSHRLMDGSTVYAIALHFNTETEPDQRIRALRGDKPTA